PFRCGDEPRNTWGLNMTFEPGSASGPGPVDQLTPTGPSQGSGGKGLTSTLSDIKDILNNVYGIIVVVASILAVFVGGAAVGHVATSASPAPATTVIRTVPAPAPSPTTGSTASSTPTVPASTQATTETPNPAGVTNLSTLKPVQNTYAYGFTTGPVQIGTTSYQQSVRFTCYGNQTSLVYDVAGFTFLDATIGVPNDAPNAAGNTATITFLKDGSTTQLGKPVTDVTGRPQKIHLDLDGAAQLEIACTATNNATHNGTSMDVTFGDATLSAT